MRPSHLFVGRVGPVLAARGIVERPQRNPAPRGTVGAARRKGENKSGGERVSSANTLHRDGWVCHRSRRCAVEEASIAARSMRGVALQITSAKPRATLARPRSWPRELTPRLHTHPPALQLALRRTRCTRCTPSSVMMPPRRYLSRLVMSTRVFRHRASTAVLKRGYKATVLGTGVATWRGWRRGGTRGEKLTGTLT